MLLISALLDYVSRAHEIEIRLLSVCRPSMSQLSRNLIHKFLSKFHLWLLLDYLQRHFFIFKKNGVVVDFLRIFFVFVNMGPYGSENFKMLLPYKSLLKAFKLFLNILSNGPHKTTVWVLEILKIEILMIFFRFC